MGKAIGPPLKQSDKDWLLKQRLFFHGTAPQSGSGRVNVSPKCSREFRIINDDTVAWLDLSGSGAETCAHLLENGRLTIMFVALEGTPRIVRLFGKGTIIPLREFRSVHNQEVISAFDDYFSSEDGKSHGIRAIVVLKINRVSQSCGYSIPKFDFVAHRTTLDDFTAAKGREGMKEYRILKNSFSIDGLPSIAQLELSPSGTAPTAFEEKDGYVFATEYGSSWWRQLRVRALLAWRFGSVGLGWRDVALVGCGVIAGGLAARLAQKK